jgi:hypothetical protein
MFGRMLSLWKDGTEGGLAVIGHFDINRGRHWSYISCDMRGVHHPTHPFIYDNTPHPISTSVHTAKDEHG